MSKVPNRSHTRVRLLKPKHLSGELGHDAAIVSSRQAVLSLALSSSKLTIRLRLWSYALTSSFRGARGGRTYFLVRMARYR